MFKYQIVCEPDGATPMALAAPEQASHEPLVIATPKPGDPKQRWELIGFAKVDPDGKATWNAFYLVNEGTGLVAQAPSNPNGTVKGNTQEVSQYDIKDDYDVTSPVRLWTLEHARDGFAIRPYGNVKQNLNAWDDQAVNQNRVGIFEWGNGKPNEVWEFKALKG